MDFESRLRNHMAEQADGIEIESAAPASITNAAQSRSRAPIATLATLAVVVVAAAGFFMLSQDDAGPVSEIAAGQADDSAGTSADTDGATFEVADYAPIEFIDISTDNSPGFGQVHTADGVYYVLSSAPGRVKFDENTTDEEFMEAYRQDTLYVYNEGSGWKTQDLGDRFISDLEVQDGVLYVVSTGSKTEDVAAFGTSSDQGQSWNWNEISGLPEIDMMTMLIGDGQAPVIFASRWGYPDYEEVLKVANDAGLNVSEFSLQNFDTNGISFIETDPDNPCALVEARYLPEIQGFRSWIAEAPTEEQEMASQEFESMTEWMKEEIQNTGCEWNEAWVSTDTDVEVYEWPEPVTVPWSDIGFTVPESWKSWSTTYTFDGKNFVDQGRPFDDSMEYGHAYVEGGELIVSVWDPSLAHAYEDGEVYEESMEFAGETLWSTSDGINWTSEQRTYTNEDDGYYGYYENFQEPKAGNHRFQLSWAEFEGDYAVEDRIADGVEEEAVAIEAETPVATTVVGPDGEAVYEEEYYEGEYYPEPEPELQRSIAGGPWETVTLAELAPNIDVGDRVLNDVRGSSAGVFLTYGPQYTGEGPPTGGLVLVHSSNGVDWAKHEVDADYVDFYGSDGGDGTILMFANKWNQTNTGGTQETKTLLVRPVG
ncbi:MAG: hypothetical protein ACRBK7_00320 [Acidimicrobiales bacterium]